MVVTGFPSSDNPTSGIFNRRAASSLARVVPVSVLHLRSWKPGRRAPVPEPEPRGFEVRTILAPQIPRSPTVNLSLYRLWGRGLVRKTLEACDLVHSVDAAFSGVLGSDWSRRAGKPHVVQLVGSDVTLLSSYRETGLALGWEEWVHGVASNSDALAREFLSLYPNVRNVRTVRRGVDLHRFHPEGPVAGPLVGKPPVRYLFLGGFPAYPRLPHGSNTKGGETLVAAWSRSEPDLMRAGASLLIAGPSLDLDQLSRWRSTLRAPERVLLGAEIPPAEVAAHMRSADAILLPSLEEGLPNVATEAAACGRAVLASRVGGCGEVVANEETGILLPPGDVDAWAEALARYSTRSEELHLMGRRARERAETVFDAEAYAAQMLDLYAAAMNELV